MPRPSVEIFPMITVNIDEIKLSNYRQINNLAVKKLSPKLVNNCHFNKT